MLTAHCSAACNGGGGEDNVVNYLLQLTRVINFLLNELLLNFFNFELFGRKQGGPNFWKLQLHKRKMYSICISDFI